MSQWVDRVLGLVANGWVAPSMRRRIAWFVAIISHAIPLPAQQVPPGIADLPGEVIPLDVETKPAFLALPKPELRMKPQPWVMYAPTLAPYPDVHERWMHERFLAAGIAVAGIDVGEAYGSPQGTQGLDQLHRYLTTTYHLAHRPCLLARSRGGLWMLAWAAEHPDRVAGLAGIYPVFDLRAYPGLDRAAGAYGLSPNSLADQLDRFNPIAKAQALLDASIPVHLIHGDVDQVVPLESNSLALAKRYREAGKGELLHLEVASGQGHNMWEGFFQSQPLVDFVIARAKEASH